MKSGESHSVQLQAPDFVFWHGGMKHKAALVMGTSCAPGVGVSLSSQVPGNSCSRHLGLGCHKSLQCPSAGAPELVAQRTLGAGQGRFVPRPAARALCWRRLSSRVNFGTNL